jgi:hypothetical protein
LGSPRQPRLGRDTDTSSSSKVTELASEAFNALTEQMQQAIWIATSPATLAANAPSMVQVVVPASFGPLTRLKGSAI